MQIDRKSLGKTRLKIKLNIPKANAIANLAVENAFDHIQEDLFIMCVALGEKQFLDVMEKMVGNALDSYKVNKEVLGEKT